MAKPAKVTCPSCNGLGSLHVDVDARRVQVACGHSKCIQAAEDRIVARVADETQRWVSRREGLDIAELLIQSRDGLQRVFAELWRHLPPGVTKGAKR
jgi:hypothetical protein